MVSEQSEKTLAGQRHRELVAVRSREQSRSAREIAPLPPIKNPQRRISARKDLQYFCEQYFPKKFKLAWSTYHLDVIKRLQEILVQGGGKLALAMPRGSGKTTLVETAVLWAILFGHCRYIVIIGANKSEALKIIEHIKDDIINTKTLLDDFPESIYPFRKLNGSALLARGQIYLGELTGILWKPDSVKFAKIPGSLSSGATLISVGINGAIRGKAIKTPDGEIQRPDMIVLDDPQTDDVARSPDQVTKLSKKIEGTIGGLVGPAEELAMLMCCTVIAENDLADQYLNRNLKPQWRGLRFKMIETMPTRMNMWEEYAELRKEDAVKATMFYRNNREAMREGAKVAWEANYTGNEIDALQHGMNIWADDFETFMSEYQNSPVNLAAQDTAVDAKTIRSRLNGMKRGVIPADTYKITAFIDIHDDILYYCVCSFNDDFTGKVIDYGTFPEQVRKEFRKGENGLITMKREFGGKKERYLAMGLEMLIMQLLDCNYQIDDDDNDIDVVKIDKLLVDSGYMPEVIQETLRKIGQPNIIRPSYGVGIGAKKAPMADWMEAGCVGTVQQLGRRLWMGSNIRSKKTLQRQKFFSICFARY
ncbi:MAG: hypothetical protein LBJ67_07165 [Planctomycetaceae bacterium]|jgi:hypothetical protein|nr:hypothetical protein [Planctomycetaceae bacterium]